MKISIFGTGYVGLVSGVCFAHLGNDVICIDRNPTKIRTLNKGISTIYEPELDNMLGDVVNNGKFKVTADAEDAILKTDITFICVGTPSNEDGSTDLTSIFEAAEQIGKVLAKKNTHHIIVVKSTVPPGTTEKVDMTLQMSGANNYGIAMNPEFLREGHAVQDFLYPDRIVIGCNKHETSDKLRELYSFTLSPGPLLVTEIKVAEMIKYTSNAMLATKISFSNEIGNICKKLGIDVYDVMIGVGADKRIGPQFLNAGVGFGGSCFPKDVKSLIHTAKVNDVEPKILQAVMDTNELQPLRLLKLAKEKTGGLSGKNVAVLGIAFKPDTDDIRESPFLTIAPRLLQMGALVTAYDPKAMENATKLLGNGIKYASSAREAVKDADIVFVLTEWEEFMDESLYEGKQVFDGRHLWNKRSDGNYEGVCW